LDDEFEDEECWVEEPEGFPWSWEAAAVAVAQHTAIILRTSASLIDTLASRMAADHNFKVDQRRFRDEVASAIETITGEE
jgi:hypothetical protein